MKNILLLAMSILDMEKIKDNYYIYEGGEVFTGQSQLEPITHMLSIELKKEEKKSAVGFYKERVMRFLDSGFLDSDFEDIHIDENEPDGGIADAIQMCQPQKFEDAVRKFAEYLKSGDSVSGQDRMRRDSIIKRSKS